MYVNKWRLLVFWSLVVSTQGNINSHAAETLHYATQDEKIVYRAAVLEYRAYSDMTDGGLAVLRENARVFVEFAERAKQQGADIIVFPEYGLTGDGSIGTLSDFMSLTQAVPDPSAPTVLCNSTDTSEAIEVVRVLSCAAAELGMYLVVNLAEQVPCEPQVNLPEQHLNEPALESMNEEVEELVEGGGGGGRREEEEDGETEEEEEEGEEIEETEEEEGEEETVGEEDETEEEEEETEEEEGEEETEEETEGEEEEEERKRRRRGKEERRRDPKEGKGDTSAEAEGRPRECLDSGFFVYNSEVVFDRNGGVAAKYRKKYLYLEPGFTPGTQADKEAIFTTDFGVNFSLQVCFDILHAGPGTSNVAERGVTDVIMSSYWVDELPFLIAPQMWQGWSEGLAVNLIVANFHNPEYGGLGSGIFRGLTSQDSLYTYDPNSGTKLLVGEVVSRRPTPLRTSTDPCDGAVAPEGTPIYQTVPIVEEDLTGIHHDNGDGKTDEENSQSETEGRGMPKEHAILHEDLERYSHSVLEKGDTLMEGSLCHNDSLCCSVTYSFPDSIPDDSTFLLLAYSGLVEKGGGSYSIFTQVCAVVHCLNENVTSCARVEDKENGASKKTAFRAHNLTGNFDTSFVYPSVLTQDLQLFNVSLWDFESSASSEKVVESTLVLHEELDNLLSLTLFGRWFDRDP